MLNRLIAYRACSSVTSGNPDIQPRRPPTNTFPISPAPSLPIESHHGALPSSIPDDSIHPLISPRDSHGPFYCIHRTRAITAIQTHPRQAPPSLHQIIHKQATPSLSQHHKARPHPPLSLLSSPETLRATNTKTKSKDSKQQPPLLCPPPNTDTNTNTQQQILVFAITFPTNPQGPTRHLHAHPPHLNVPLQPASQPASLLPHTNQSTHQPKQWPPQPPPPLYVPLHLHLPGPLLSFPPPLLLFSPPLSYLPTPHDTPRPTHPPRTRPLLFFPFSHLLFPSRPLT